MEIIETKDLLRELSQIKNDIDELYNTLNIDDKKKQLSLLIEETFKEKFWQDQTHSTQVQQQITQLKRTIEPWVSLKKEVDWYNDFMVDRVNQEVGIRYNLNGIIWWIYPEK